MEALVLDYQDVALLLRATHGKELTVELHHRLRRFFEDECRGQFTDFAVVRKSDYVRALTSLTPEAQEVS